MLDLVIKVGALMSGTNSSSINRIFVHSMTTDSHNTIVQLHRSLGITTPSHVTVMHMSEALESGNTTHACLRASLIRSDAYRIAVRSRFRDACYTLLGDDDEDAFRDFDLALTASNSEPTEVTDDDISSAVRYCSRYERRYVDIIQKNYAMLMNGEQPSERFTSDMLTQFRADHSFTICDLHAIVREMHVKSRHDPPRPPIEDVAMSQTPPPKNDAINVTPPTEEKTCVDSIQISTIANNDVMQQILIIGDREYGRPWYALEFLAYVDKCSSIVDPCDLAKHVSTLLRTHLACWEETRGVYQELLGDVLDEIDFVRKYVGRHNTLDFSDVVRTEILKSPTYEQRIKNRLMTVQKRLYDVLLDVDDMKTLFEQAKSKSVGVSDDAVATLLHNHRRECDALISEVVRVYVDVLSREPDQTELETDLRQFRDARVIVLSTHICDIDCLVAQKILLAVRLSKGYEFHDVIKTRLRSAYHKASGGVHVPMQLLYIMLEKVLTVSESTLCNTSDARGLAGVVLDEINKALDESC